MIAYSLFYFGLLHRFTPRNDGRAFYCHYKEQLSFYDSIQNLDRSSRASAQDDKGGDAA